uniref:CLK4 associating serine/arginine rich protein n=1 Tax=Malurus cyaneus samueli TaxID=2593467 RepID=A0A8C5THC3_9PASS
HLDSAVALAAESPVNMMPWQGDTNNMIDRFDVRAHLDFIPMYTPTLLTPRTGSDERKCNYERYRGPISEEQCLYQIYIDELYGGLQKPNEDEKKKLAEKKASIGYTYEDSTVEELENSLEKRPGDEEDSEEDSNTDEDEVIPDIDVEVDVDELNQEQVADLNKQATTYGMAEGDFVRMLRKDKEEAEAIKNAKALEEEKAMYSVRGRFPKKTREFPPGKSQKTFSQPRAVFPGPPLPPAAPGIPGEAAERPENQPPQVRLPTSSSNPNISPIPEFLQLFPPKSQNFPLKWRRFSPQLLWPHFSPNFPNSTPFFFKPIFTQFPPSFSPRRSRSVSRERSRRSARSWRRWSSQSRSSRSPSDSRSRSPSPSPGASREKPPPRPAASPAVGEKLKKSYSGFFISFQEREDELRAMARKIRMKERERREKEREEWERQYSRQSRSPSPRYGQHSRSRSRSPHYRH